MSASASWDTLFNNWKKRIEALIREHPLQVISWEATRRCNLRCVHCGSPSEDANHKEELSTDEIVGAFEQIARDFDMSQFRHINITGGEPFVRKDLLEVLRRISQKPYYRNIDIQTNGIILADYPDLLDELKKYGVTGLGISIDGLEETHDTFRQVCGGFAKAFQVSRLAVEHGYIVTVSVVAHAKNVHEIPELFALVKKEIHPRVFRIMTIDPMGRAEFDSEYLLSPQQLRQVIDFLKTEYQRSCSTYSDPKATMVELGCGGWMGTELEGMFRPFIFHCIAGINNLGILYDGKLASCSNIPRDFIEGDFRTDRIKTVWETRYQRYRNIEWKQVGDCADCDQWEYCHGGPMHKRLADGEMLNCLYKLYHQSKDYGFSMCLLLPLRGGLLTMHTEGEYRRKISSRWADDVLSTAEPPSFHRIGLFFVLCIFRPFGTLLPLVKGLKESRASKGFAIVVNLILCALLLLAVASFVLSCFPSFQPASSEQSETSKSASSEQSESSKLNLSKKIEMIIHSRVVGIIKNVTLYGIIWNLFVLPFLFLVRTINRNTTLMLDDVERILGHKLWAEKGTFSLLDNILRQQQGKRAKWFILKFLAHLAEERIKSYEKPTFYYCVSTPEEGWHACRYSRFLHENMAHAEDSILWLVDPHDYFNIILPEIMQYTLAAIAIAQYQQTPELNFKQTKPLSEAYQKILTAAAKDLSIDKNILWNVMALDRIKDNPSEMPALIQKREYERLWRIFHECILRPLSLLGVFVAANKEIPEDINDYFKFFSEEYLIEVFPHLNAFGNATVSKERIIWLSGTRGPESLIQWLNNRVAEFWQGYKKYWQEEQETWNSRLSNFKQVPFRKDVVNQALDFFAQSAGGEKIVKIRYITNPPSSTLELVDKMHLDLGIYDSHFVVWATPIEEKLRRKVRWYYIPNPQEAYSPSETGEETKGWYKYWLNDLKGEMAKEASSIPDNDHNLIAYGATALLGSTSDYEEMSYADFRKAIELLCEK